MLCRTARISRRAPCRSVRYQRQRHFVRPNSTSALHADVDPLLDNTPPQETTRHNNGHKSGANYTQYPSLRTARLRFWEPVHSIADVWAVKRVMEKKYGAILETYFHKDFEMPDRYQLIAYLIFRDPEALERIPEGGEDFTILSPEMPKKKIHEISVKDIEAYAGSEEYQPGFEFDKPPGGTSRRVIGGNIRRASTEYCSTLNHRKFFQGTARGTMEHFLKWGGFNAAQMDTSRRVSELDLFKPDAREEHARMRAALQICSRIISQPIPQGVNLTAGPSPETARIFAGLYNSVQTPAVGRLNGDLIDDEDDYAIAEESPIEESPAPSSSVDVSPSSIPPVSEVEPDAPSIETTPSPMLTPPPVKRPVISAEEKKKLAMQMNAARLLQKAATPVRRKPLKLVVVEPPRKQQSILDESLSGEEPKPPKRGFLAKLASLFGR